MNSLKDQTDDVDGLRSEIARLRELVGPNEASYVQLQVDLLAARDAVIGAEHEVGVARGYNQALETEVVRLQRDFDWFRRKVIDRAKRARGVTGRLGRR
jgi:hypothetical protein